MRITVLAVGKIREKYFRDALEEYKKRISRYGKLTIVEVPDEKAPENLSPAGEAQVLEREGDRILEKIPEDAYLISLALEGESPDSPGLARLLEKLPHQGYGHVCFLIGGSLGLDPRVKEKSRMLLSFSPMTFPHQLMRVVLLEQIYRSFRIIRGEPYHK